MKKELTPVEVIQQEFRKQGWTDVTAFLKETGSTLSLQSATNIVHRNKQMAVLAMLNMAYSLNLPIKTIVWMAKELGDTYLWRMIDKAALTSKEERMLRAYRLLTDEQQRLIMSLSKEFSKEASHASSKDSDLP